MRALQNFRQAPFFFGEWFLEEIRRRPLPWAWDDEEADLLLGWAWKFKWLQAIQDQDPSKLKAAAALATLLAQAYRDCFREDGDHAVWKRLGPRLGLQESVLGVGATRVSQLLKVHRPAVDSDLVHVIPFVHLVGCPPQALPLLGQRLKAKAAVPQRFKALFESQWESPRVRDAIVRWLKGEGSQPPELGDPEAQLLKLERPKVSAARESFRWRCLLLAGQGYKTVLAPTGKLEGTIVQGREDGPISVLAAMQFGVPQMLGRDGRVTIDGTTTEVPWGLAEPSLWISVNSPAPEVSKAYERTVGRTGELCCLPPGWSLDGEAEPEWRWVPVSGRVSFFDPDGAPWDMREEGAPLEVHDAIAIGARPGLPIIHRIPRGLQDLSITGGELGSTLGSGEAWAQGEDVVPPQGHLVLHWRSNKGTKRRKEVFCMPSLQLTRQEGAKLRVWVRGMERLIGREDAQWYELSIKVTGNRWEASIELQNWNEGRPPLELQLSGASNTWGGLLRGNTAPFRNQLSSPWAADIRFFEQLYLGQVRIELKLPEGVEAKVWAEDGGEIWSEKSFRDRSQLASLELQQLIAPPLATMATTARPLRVDLVWPMDDDHAYQSVNLFRIFPRPAEVGVSIHGGCIEVGGRDPVHPFKPGDWSIRIGSTHTPKLESERMLLELKGLEVGPGTWQFRAPDLPAKGAPYFVQLIRNDGAGRPLSVHADASFTHQMVAAEAFSTAVRRKGIGGVELPGGLGDHRDRLLQFAFNLSETHDLESLIPEEIAYWLNFLDHDFLFSQPWTLGIALRHPEKALQHLAGLHSEPSHLAEALARLGQSGWCWWLISQPMMKRANAATSGRLDEALRIRAADAIDGLRTTQNPGMRLTLLQRYCEEGLHLHLAKGQQLELFQAMGLPLEWLKAPRNWIDVGRSLLQNEATGPLGDCIHNLVVGPFVPRTLPRHRKSAVTLGTQAPFLESLNRLAAWADAYRKWSPGASQSLICAEGWSEATPEIFRYFAVPLTAFTSFNLIG